MHKILLNYVLLSPIVFGGVRPKPPQTNTPNPLCLLPFVVRLGLGLRLVGRIGSWVLVSVSFQQKIPAGFCPTMSFLRQQKTGVMTRGVDLPSSPAYNVKPVTNTSSSSCTNNGRPTSRWVLDACRRSSRLCFSHFSTRTVDNAVDLYAAKPDIRSESRFFQGC